MRGKGSLTRWMLLMTSVCAFSLSRLQAETRISDDDVISAGITVVEGASLRTEPDTNSTIIMELEFGTPFLILTKQSFTEGRRLHYWYRVVLTDRETVGWIISEEGREGDLGVVDLEKDDFAGLYYAIACQSFWGYADYHTAEKLFLHILGSYSDRRIPVEDEIVGGIYHVNGKMATFERLAELYKEKEEYEKSIEYYGQIAKSKEAKRCDIVNAMYNIMLIHEENLRDEEKTVELCHRIIREFPDEEIYPYYESNLWVDIEAAGIIVATYSIDAKDMDKLAKESEKIIAETSNPSVILIATRGIVISQITGGKYERAKATLLEAMKKYPKDIRSYFKTPVNFTVGLLAGTIEAVVSKQGDYAKAIEFVVTAKNNLQDKEIVDFTDYKIAQLLDEGNGDRQQVLSAYEELGDLRVWDPVGGDIYPRKIRQRIDQLRTYQTEEALVSRDNTVMKPGLRSKPESYESIPEGTCVTIIYRDTTVTTVDEQVGTWAKVKLSDGRLGWVFDGFLSVILRRQLFSPLEPKEKLWFTEGADPNRTSAVNANVINEPVLVKVFHNVATKEAVFSDVNDDLIPDILACSRQGLVVIDGRTEKIIWAFSCRRGSVPVVQKDIVYVVAFSKGAEHLYALSKKTGKTIWKALVGTLQYGYLPSSPCVRDSLIYVGTWAGDLLAFDAEHGKLRWKFASSYPIPGGVTEANDLLYFASRDEFQAHDKLFALRASSGKLVWESPLQPKGYGYVPAVCVEDCTLFCSGANGYLYALSPETGEIQWQKRLTHKGHGSFWFKPSSCRGTVYCVTQEREIYAIDAKTGDIKWKYTYSHSLYGSPAIVNGALYIRSEDSYLHAISLADGQLLWKFKLGSGAHGGVYSPSIAQDLAFIGSTDNNLYVIGEQ